MPSVSIMKQFYNASLNAMNNRAKPDIYDKTEKIPVIDMVCDLVPGDYLYGKDTGIKLKNQSRVWKVLGIHGDNILCESMLSGYKKTFTKTDYYIRSVIKIGYTEAMAMNEKIRRTVGWGSL